MAFIGLAHLDDCDETTRLSCRGKHSYSWCRRQDGRNDESAVKAVMYLGIFLSITRRFVLVRHLRRPVHPCA